MKHKFATCRVAVPVEKNNGNTQNINQPINVQRRKDKDKGKEKQMASWKERQGESPGADPEGTPGPPDTKNEAPAPKFYKIEAPEWQF